MADSKSESPEDATVERVMWQRRGGGWRSTLLQGRSMHARHWPAHIHPALTPSCLSRDPLPMQPPHTQSWWCLEQPVGRRSCSRPRSSSQGTRSSQSWWPSCGNSSKRRAWCVVCSVSQEGGGVMWCWRQRWGVNDAPLHAIGLNPVSLCYAPTPCPTLDSTALAS